MAVDKAEFRRLLSHFAAGVTVVTTLDSDRRPYGLTATAFSSVSLVPPLVLVCIDKKAESFPHFDESGVFAVNFLSSDQKALSQKFAVSGGDKFSEQPYHTAATGAPILPGALGFVDCTIVHCYEGGDHVIYVGQVEAGEAEAGQPLLHFRGAYGGITEA